MKKKKQYASTSCLKKIVSHLELWRTLVPLQLCHIFTRHPPPCLVYYSWDMMHNVEKRALISYANSKGPDHHAHSFSLILAFAISPHTTLSTDSVVSLDGSVGCAVRLETRRSRDQPPPRSATFFRGDWSWNIFYGHSLPSADSKRVVVSFWRKNVHNTG